MEFKAKIIDGVLDVFPTTTVNEEHDKDGKLTRRDVTVHMMDVSKINQNKQEVINKLARGEKVDISIEDGKRNIQ